MSTTTSPNACAVCNTSVKFRLNLPDWATDGTGTIPFKTLEGAPNTVVVHLCCASQAEHSLDFPDKATVTDGIVRWNSNGNVPPADCLDLLAFLGFISEADVAASATVRDGETAAFLAEYRRNSRPLTGEALAEARAAFGPGEVIVDVISGVKTYL